MFVSVTFFVVVKFHEMSVDPPPALNDDYLYESTPDNLSETQHQQLLNPLDPLETTELREESKKPLRRHAKAMLRHEARKKGILGTRPQKIQELQELKRQQDKIVNLERQNSEYEQLLDNCVDVFKCAICWQTLNRPVTLDCGHSYCGLCVISHEQKAVDIKCPSCRKSYHNAYEHRVNVAIQQCLELMVGAAQYQQADQARLTDYCKAFVPKKFPNRTEWSASCIQLLQLSCILLGRCIQIRTDSLMNMDLFTTIFNTAKLYIPDLHVFMYIPSNSYVLGGDIVMSDIEIPLGVVFYVLCARSKDAGRLQLNGEQLSRFFWSCIQMM